MNDLPADQTPLQRLHANLTRFDDSWSIYIYDHKNRPILPQLLQMKDAFTILSQDLQMLENQMRPEEALFLGLYLTSNILTVRKALYAKNRSDQERERLTATFNKPSFKLFEKLGGSGFTEFKDWVSKKIIDVRMRTEEESRRDDLRYFDERHKKLERQAPTNIQTPVAQSFWNCLADLTHRESCFRFHGVAPHATKQTITTMLR